MTFWNQIIAEFTPLTLMATAFVAGVLMTALAAWVLVQRRLNHAEQDRIGLQARLDSEQRITEERAAAFDTAREQLEASFSLLSGEVLKRNTESFLQLAEERHRRHHAQSEQHSDEHHKAIARMIKPIADALEKTEVQVRELEKERKQSFGALEKHLQVIASDHQALREETQNLVKALRRPEMRGQWGELTLKRLVELAGMSQHCDFTEQVSVHTDDGIIRPDMVINLPDKRDIVVDVKTPLDAYLSAQEARTQSERDAHLKRHVANVRARVKELASKAYWQQFPNSPDFVVLFIPGEQFLAAALDLDMTLLEDALRSKVILASPTSLIALLRAVAFSWRQVDLIDNAQQIRSLAEEFHKRVAVFSEHFARLGKALDSTVTHFNKTAGSLERQVLPATRKLTELGVDERREIVTTDPIEKQVRD